MANTIYQFTLNRILHKFTLGHLCTLHKIEFTGLWTVAPPRGSCSEYRIEGSLNRSKVPIYDIITKQRHPPWSSITARYPCKWPKESPPSLALGESCTYTAAILCHSDGFLERFRLQPEIWKIPNMNVLQNVLNSRSASITLRVNVPWNYKIYPLF